MGVWVGGTGVVVGGSEVFVSVKVGALVVVGVCGAGLPACTTWVNCAATVSAAAV